MKSKINFGDIPKESWTGGLLCVWSNCG